MPPDAPAYDLRRLWLEPDEFAAYYGGFANEGLWPLCHQVDVRPKFRTEDWEAYQIGQCPFRGGDRSGTAEHRHAGVHPGLPSRARRALAARAAAGGAHGALLAHSVALSRSPAHLSLAPRDPGGSAGERSAGVPARTRSPQFRARRRRGARCGDRGRRRADPVRGPQHERDRGADRRRLRSHSDGGQRRGARCGAAAPDAGLRPDVPAARSRRRSTRLHEGHSRTARGARSRLHAPARAPRPADVSADRRAVAIESRELQRDRIRDRSEGGAS